MTGQPEDHPQHSHGRAPYLLAGLAAAALTGFAAYSLWWEPSRRLRITRWRIFRPEWQGRQPVRIVVISDLHAGAPQISLDRISRIVARANALAPDIAVILGDLAGAHPFTWGGVCKADIAGRLAAFKGRLGRFAVLGNQGWWQGSGLYLDHCGPVAAGDALEDVGITVLDNQAKLIGGAEQGFWLAGLGEPHPYWGGGRDGDRDGDANRDGGANKDRRKRRWRRRDRMADLARAIADVGDSAPVVLLAHEPDVFPLLDRLDPRIPVQISGQYQGGAIRRNPDGAPVRIGADQTYGWGRFDENGRTLIVSGGIGCSVRPMAAGCVPEITVIEIAQANHF